MKKGCDSMCEWAIEKQQKFVTLLIIYSNPFYHF